MATAAQIKSIHTINGKISRKMRTWMKEFTDIVFANQTQLAAITADAVPDEVTATVGGGTTGLIPATAQHINVTSGAATEQISLPAAIVGKKITGYVGANGCELISAVAAHKVNNVVVGATNEAAIPATTYFELVYVATNEWILTATTELGAVITAIIPDIL